MADTLFESHASADVVATLQRAHQALSAAEHLQLAMASLIDVLGDKVIEENGNFGLVCALEACIWSLSDKIDPSLNETRSMLTTLQLKTPEASHG